MATNPASKKGARRALGLLMTAAVLLPGLATTAGALPPGVGDLGFAHLLRDVQMHQLPIDGWYLQVDCASIPDPRVFDPNDPIRIDPNAAVAFAARAADHAIGDLDPGNEHGIPAQAQRLANDLASGVATPKHQVQIRLFGETCFWDSQLNKAHWVGPVVLACRDGHGYPCAYASRWETFAGGPASGLSITHLATTDCAALYFSDDCYRFEVAPANLATYDVTAHWGYSGNGPVPSLTWAMSL